MRLVDQWLQLPPDQEPSQQSVTWVATAEAHANAPLMNLRVYRLADGRWKGEISYDYDPEGDVWSQDGFEAREGAQAWAEMKVQSLAGGGGR